MASALGSKAKQIPKKARQAKLAKKRAHDMRTKAKKMVLKQVRLCKAKKGSPCSLEVVNNKARKLQETSAKVKAKADRDLEQNINEGKNMQMVLNNLKMQGLTSLQQTREAAQLARISKCSSLRRKSLRVEQRTKQALRTIHTAMVNAERAVRATAKVRCKAPGKDMRNIKCELRSIKRSSRKAAREAGYLEKKRLRAKKKLMLALKKMNSDPTTPSKTTNKYLEDQEKQLIGMLNQQHYQILSALKHIL
jgi:hypothetical protein